MRLKLFTSVLNVTMHRVCRAAGRSRDDFRLEVMSEGGIAKTLSVLCDGVVRLYPIGNNSQWARALMNDALDGSFAAESAHTMGGINPSPTDMSALVTSTTVDAIRVGASEALTLTAAPGWRAFVEQFSQAVEGFARHGRILSVGQAGPLCSALRQARESEWEHAQHQVARALSAPGLDGDSVLSHPALDLAFIERQFNAVKRGLNAHVSSGLPT